MKLVVLGLSITSSWGNGHATTYRALLREMAARGHEITFLERDVPWYADNRDAPKLSYAEIGLYQTLAELRRRHHHTVAAADAVIVGSYVPEGIAVGEWVLATAGGPVAFYDIDTPVTVAKLRKGECDYISPGLVRRYDVYLSFTGGPMLRRLENEYGSPRARPLYCAVDPKSYFPEPVEASWDLGYLGTYSADRQPSIDRFLVQSAQRWAAGRFVVAGPQYPAGVRWPDNVERIEHLPPARHRRFYNAQRFTLNVTRADMIEAGYSPSVRLFEAAACGTAILTDPWEGLETIFAPGSEILVARDTDDVLRTLREMPETSVRELGQAARRRVLQHHTAAHRAGELESHLQEVLRPAAAPSAHAFTASPLLT